jgi:hypothetical protein
LDACSSRCTVLGWIASNVLENSFTVVSGPRGSSARCSHDMNELGCASRMPGRTRVNRSAARPGSESTITTIGNPRYSEIASAVNSREWTNDTWMAMVSRRRSTGRVTAYCGR